MLAQWRFLARRLTNVIRPLVFDSGKPSRVTMSINKLLIICGLGIAFSGVLTASGADSLVAGPLYAHFPLTVGEGQKTEILGPLFYADDDSGSHQWAVPPLGMSYTDNTNLQIEQFDFAYPLLTWRRFGREYRWQFFQLFNAAGGQVPGKADEHRVTLFPFIFIQTSATPSQNYAAVLPFYGHVRDRLFRNEIDFVMLPLYVKSRKADVVTWNMPWPFFDIHKGDGLHGWEAWPLVGREHKVPTVATNGFGDTNIVGGFDHFFMAWPFYFRETNGIGTTNQSKEHALIPFYDFYRSPLRDQTSYPWPFGLTHTIDRENQYEEWDAPWPLVEFAHGPGKTTRRVWPFFNRSHNDSVADDWYFWPVWMSKSAHIDPLYYRRTRVLFFLYQSLIEQSTDTGRALRRQDFFPFYTHVRQPDGKERLQVLSLFEPLFNSTEAIERDYSPLCALWRSERDPKTGLASSSLLWNLYRREAGPQAKKISLLFGLFQYQSSPASARWRVFYIPFGGARPKAAASRPAG
jgi:hypothetical protein